MLSSLAKVKAESTKIDTSMNKKERPLWLGLKGMAMGMAEVVPGVSGGTIAFITGIYETLINTIKSFDAEAIKLLFRGQLRDLWQHVNGRFILFLLAGMVGGVVIGVLVISNLMETQPEILWAFFFGLILASAWYVAKQVKQWNASIILLLILGAAFAFWITQITPAEASINPLYVFICGMIAISALILPGISGSFIMLLMGMYTVIIPLVKQLIKEQDFAVLGTLSIFGAGCIVGLITFSRVLSWMFKHYEGQTLGLLTGFMVGSLAKIWPWRNPTLWVNDAGEFFDAGRVKSLISTDELRVITEENVLPGAYAAGEPQTIAVIIAAIVGLSLVLLMDRFSSPPKS